MARVERDTSQPRGEQWAVWSFDHVVARLPTRSRAEGFADLIAAIQPMDQDVIDLKQDIRDLQRRIDELERNER